MTDEHICLDNIEGLLRDTTAFVEEAKNDRDVTQCALARLTLIARKLTVADLLRLLAMARSMAVISSQLPSRADAAEERR